MILLFFVRLVGWLLVLGALAGWATLGYAVYLMVTGIVETDPDAGLITSMRGTLALVWGFGATVGMFLVGLLFLAAGKTLALLREIHERVMRAPEAPATAQESAEPSADEDSGKEAEETPREPTLETRDRLDSSAA
ncbi:MAG: hypothetical protein QNJ94_21730 [Alphaproteobacteria bacterium]|nr:hypothetical protein [Alphaproteobacteria bacterium]